VSSCVHRDGGTDSLCLHPAASLCLQSRRRTVRVGEELSVMALARLDSVL
jgi:hypothetical protein